MQISFATLISLVATLQLVLALPHKSATDNLQDLNKQAIRALKSHAYGASNTTNTCSVSNAIVRRDWKHLSKKERRNYIDAVRCLMTKPSKADPSFAPGAVTRYDDFLAVHLNQTQSIHATGNFMTWHRYFLYIYEIALRDECGYKGYQPYWNWFDGSDFSKSAVFDGSETSMGGDGAFFPHNGTMAGVKNIPIPPGKGGGCVKDGPFVDIQANLGPVTPAMDGMSASPTGPLGPNPRCRRRDLSKYAIDNWMTATNLHNITIGAASGSIKDFQNELQGRFQDKFLGMHAAGHLTMGGDSADLYSSPNDPVFYLHHAMVDYVYWIWQALHPNVANDIHGTITLGNKPPSRDALKTDLLDMGVNGPTVQIADTLDTLGNTPFCYIYV